MDADFPRPMTIWAGVPTPVRTAFTWPANNRTYFFGNSDYYRFDDKAITVSESCFLVLSVIYKLAITVNYDEEKVVILF